jgi:surfactin synthase thioesterase subunit
MIRLSTWLLTPAPNPDATLRLFCFPYSGAAASIYYSWTKLLPPAVELISIQLPGRANRLSEPLLTSVQPAVDEIVEAISQLLEKPFALFGHSLGAIIAFEVARSLRRGGLSAPARLFVSSHCAPQLPDDSPQMHSLSDIELIESLQRLNGMASEILENAELMALLLPILRADLTMSETYDYQDDKPLSCPISAYGGLQDSHVGRNELDAWRSQTTGEFRLRMFPGDHFYINASRPLLLEALARDLDSTLRF